MKTKIPLFIFLVLAIMLSLFFVTLSEAAVESGSDKVKISGKVRGVYDRDAGLQVTAHKDIFHNPEKQLDFIAITEVDSFSEYLLEVPKGIGKIYVTAFNPPDKATELIPYNVPFAVYSGNPLNIKDQDIDGVDIVFRRKTPVLMDDYNGRTVTISGRISMDNYKEGHIGITANVDRQGPPGVNMVIIDKPGKYSLKVPKDFGELYIAVFNVKDGISLGKGIYSKNPIVVKNRNIKNIDIAIE